jgi:hypothetical protein
MEEQSALLKNISHQLENLNREIPMELQVKILNAETCISSLSAAQSSLINKMAVKPDPFAITNAIQVRIDDNVRMLAELCRGNLEIVAMGWLIEGARWW